VSRPAALTSLPPKGQKIVEEWLDSSAHFLVNPLIAVGCLVDPQAIFVGGRLPPELVERLATHLNRALVLHGRDVLTLAEARPAALGVDAPVIGAALLPLNDRLFPSRVALMKCAEG
jgi:predicted NBD/HSP70 family sugar kinase